MEERSAILMVDFNWHQSCKYYIRTFILPPTNSLGMWWVLAAKNGRDPPCSTFEASRKASLKNKKRGASPTKF